MARPATQRGFSLLEVMVALAIFGLMISGILAAQAGLAASNKKAANMGLATNLARCRMTEAEETLLRKGYPEIDDIDTGAQCCESQEGSNFTCDTKVEKVTLPNPPSGAGLDGDGGAGGLPPGLLGLAGGADGGSPTGALDLDAGLSGMGNQLQSQTGGQGGAGLINMVMGMVYPTMKPMMEASIRRITVTVHWKEGPKGQDFTIVQFVTNPQRGGFVGASPSSSAAPGNGLAPAPQGATPIIPFGGTTTPGGAR
jgi:general secretion pathway protein I